MNPRRTFLAFAVAASLGLATGCQGEPEPSLPLQATAAGLSVEQLTVAPAGDLAGQRFQAKSAFYRVNSYPGRERIDLYFDDPAPETCGLPLPRDTRRVFLRFPGLQAFETGEWAVEADAEDPPFTVHYERGVEHGWRGESGGVAVLAIDDVEDRVVRGRVNVCFDDGRQSCVRGAFAAERCVTRVDGQAIREGVGLHEPLPDDVVLGAAADDAAADAVEPEGEEGHE